MRPSMALRVLPRRSLAQALMSSTLSHGTSKAQRSGRRRLSPRLLVYFVPIQHLLGSLIWRPSRAVLGWMGAHPRGTLMSVRTLHAETSHALRIVGCEGDLCCLE